MDDQTKALSPEESQEPENDFEVRERKRWIFFGLPFTFTTYTLTPRKLVLARGLLTTLEDDILLYRVMDTSLRRSLWQKIFGLGTISVASSDHSHPELVIQNIRGAREFKELLDEQVEKERLRVRFRTGEYLGSDPADDPEDPHFSPL